MSLNYRFDKCKALMVMTDEQREVIWPTTQSIIFQTISNGMGEITEENAEEFFIRQDIWCRLNAFTPIPPEAIVQHIGLTTNVSPMTRAAWTRKTMADAVLRSADRFRAQF